MKAFIDRVFKSKQQKQKELLDDITNTEVIEENNCGVCIDPLNALELKKVLIAMHMDVEKSELMAKNGKKTVFEKYDWKSQTPILSKVYDTLSR